MLIMYSLFFFEGGLALSDEKMTAPVEACVIICKVEAGTTSMILHGTILQGGRKVFLIYRRNCHGQSWKKTVGADVKGCFPKYVPSM